MPRTRPVASCPFNTFGFLSRKKPEDECVFKKSLKDKFFKLILKYSPNRLLDQAQRSFNEKKTKEVNDALRVLLCSNTRALFYEWKTLEDLKCAWIRARKQLDYFEQEEQVDVSRCDANTKSRVDNVEKKKTKNKGANKRTGIRKGSKKPNGLNNTVEKSRARKNMVKQMRLCEVCGKTYKRMDTFSRHKHRHLGVSFTCFHRRCFKTFTRRDSLRKHITKVHGPM